MNRWFVVFYALVVVLTALPVFGSQAAKLADDGKPVVYFGVIPRYNPMIMYRNYQPIMDYLTEQTPYHFELKLARGYAEAVEFLRDGVVQVASLGDVTFFEANKGFGAVPVVRPLNKMGRAEYRSVIIVPKGSPLHDIGGLKGKRFAFGNPHSTSGNLIPRVFLYKHGVTLFDLSNHENLDSHDAVAKAVLKGKVDAGAVKDVVARRYQNHGLTILASSGPIPAVPVVVRPDADPALVSAIREALLGIDTSNPAMVKRMKSWDPEFSHGFVPAEEADYQAIFNMMEAIPGGCGNRCH